MKTPKFAKKFVRSLHNFLDQIDPMEEENVPAQPDKKSGESKKNPVSRPNLDPPSTPTARDSATGDQLAPDRDSNTGGHAVESDPITGSQSPDLIADSPSSHFRTPRRREIAGFKNRSDASSKDHKAILKHDRDDSHYRERNEQVEQVEERFHKFGTTVCSAVLTKTLTPGGLPSLLSKLELGTMNSLVVDLDQLSDWIEANSVEAFCKKAGIRFDEKQYRNEMKKAEMKARMESGSAKTKSSTGELKPDADTGSIQPISISPDLTKVAKSRESGKLPESEKVRLQSEHGEARRRTEALESQANEQKRRAGVQLPKSAQPVPKSLDERKTNKDPDSARDLQLPPRKPTERPIPERVDPKSASTIPIPPPKKIPSGAFGKDDLKRIAEKRGAKDFLREEIKTENDI